MAKELPYFKFEPNQWDNGNIQMCSHLEKGVFMDLCSMYWSRLGDLSYKLAIQKICGGNANALDSLYENKIFDVIDGKIYIKFLSEQLNGFENISERNSKIAKEGWEKRRKQRDASESNANAMPTHSERNAIREEERREEKRKEDKIIKENLSDFQKKVIEFEEYRRKIKKPIKDASKESFLKKLYKLSNGDESVAIEILDTSIANGWQGIFELKTQNNGNSKKQSAIDNW